MSDGRRLPMQPASVFLGVLGATLLIASVIGLFLDKQAGVIGTFVVVGGALSIAAAVAPRLEGTQELGPQGAKINVARLRHAVEQGERELETKKLPELEEVLKDG